MHHNTLYFQTVVWLSADVVVSLAAGT